MTDAESREQSVSKKDELIWRITVQKIIDRCLENINNITLEDHVKAFRESLFFNVPGLPFKTKIIKQEEELKQKQETLIEEEKEKRGRQFYSRPIQAKFKIYLHKWYWTSFFEFLQDILADHDAMVKSKERIDEWTETEKEIEELK